MTKYRKGEEHQHDESCAHPSEKVKRVKAKKPKGKAGRVDTPNQAFPVQSLSDDIYTGAEVTNDNITFTTFTASPENIVTSDTENSWVNVAAYATMEDPLVASIKQLAKEIQDINETNSVIEMKYIIEEAERKLKNLRATLD
jgi:hypothetical protein